jgi:hypothetical protein
VFPGAISASIFSALLVYSCMRGEPGNSIQSDRCLVPGCERKQGDIPGLLDGARQAALVCGANTSQAPGHNLAALGHKSLQQTHVAVRNRIDLLGAELADLLAAEELAASAGAACGAWSTGPAAGPWS